jgi:AcrR family transcriptional regulator
VKTEYRFAEALKNMMAEVPLDSISVTTLAKKCHVNRQTFYYHFHDIYDLLTLVFLNEEIEGADNTKNVRELLDKVFKYYLKNKGFIDATLNSAGKELFEEFCYNVCYKTFLRFVASVQDSKKLHINDRKSVARFYALAYSHSIVYYLSTYKTKTYEGLLNCFLFETNSAFEDAINRLLIVRSKQK